MPAMTGLFSILKEMTTDWLRLCYLQQKKYAEVAEELNISPDTVKKHIMKALKLLKELYNCEKEK